LKKKNILEKKTYSGRKYSGSGKKYIVKNIYR